MTNYEVFNHRKVSSTKIWMLFLFFGWSYGSLGQGFKQFLFYITLGGFGLWTLYRLFTLSGAIRKRNRYIAIKCGLTEDELKRLALRYR